MFDPKIVAFCCEQSGIVAAEMAEALRGKLPDNIEVIPVPCAGRIETVFLLRALEGDADGIVIFACYEENCQYVRGNIRAKSRLAYAQDKLSKIGLEKGRLEICHVATNSGVKLIDVLKAKGEELRALGPNAFNRGG